MANEVKFLQGNYEILSGLTLSQDTLYFAKDKEVMGAAGKLYYGQPTLSYTGDKIVLWGVKGESKSEEHSVKLGEVDLTLDSFLEDAKYFGSTTSVTADMEAVATWTKGKFTVEEVTEEYKSAFEVGEGDLPKEHSAIVMIMHKETSGSTDDEHSLVVIPIGKLMGDVQTEVDNIETAVGLDDNGSYVATSEEGTSITTGATSVLSATTALDKAVTILNGDNTVEGSVKKQIKDTIESLDAAVSGETQDGFVKVEVVEANGLLTGVIVTDNVVAITAASASNKGLAEASDVKANIDASKTVVEGDGDNKNLTVTGTAATDGHMVYTVTETGLTPEADGVAVEASNTVAGNLTALDDEVKQQTLTAGTVNGVDVAIEHTDEGTSFEVEVGATNISISAYTAPTYDDKFSAATENIVDESDTVNVAINKVDNKVAALVDEVIADEQVTAAGIEALAKAAGTQNEETQEIKYEANTAATYISNATSLKDADDKLDAAIKALQDQAVTSDDKTIKVNVSSATSGTNIEVNIDGTSIKKGDGGVLSSVIEGVTGNAVSVSEATATENQKVQLTIDTKEATTGCAKIALSQSANGLFAEVGLDNVAATSTKGGVGLTQDTTGKIKATIYWGSF